jgi:hypothetical protein
MASAYLSKSMGAFTGRDQWCMSYWIKRSITGSDQRLYTSYYDANNFSFFRLDSSDQLEFRNYNNGAYNTTIKTNRVFKDTNAWYHVLLLIDTPQATAADRVGIYINGEKETSLATSSYPSQNQNINIWNTGFTMYIGSGQTGSQVFDGSMTHIHHIDGTSEPVSKFGETDSTTGIWKPKTSPSVTYGNNGVFLDFADSSAMGNDVSGKNNDFTVNNTITQTIDTPSNVFCTLNPLSTAPVASSSYFSNGNTVFDAPSVSPYDISCGSTLGVSKGKYYWEVKWVIDGGGSQAAGIGIYESDQQIDNFGNMRTASGKKNVIWDLRHDLYVNGSDTGNDYTAASGDIVGLALDLDNGTLKIHKNGTYFNSGNAVTTAIDTSKTYLLLASPNGGSNHSTLSFNFGNGYFGTTAVSSAGTNAGIGTFEYDVPSGYKALCTKNINAQEYS